MSEKEIIRAQYTMVTGAVDPSDAAYSTGTTDPVQMVTWYDALEFCNDMSTLESLTPVYTITRIDPVDSGHPLYNATVTATWTNNGYRLPTEMEWMWAAMGATAGTSGYSKALAGSTGTNAIGDFAWCWERKNLNPYTTSRPVGGKLSNELGLYDMSGNVWEWNWDWYADYPAGALNDYRGASSGAMHVFRGGCWFYDATHCTVASRYTLNPLYQDKLLGFRVVRP